MPRIEVVLEETQEIMDSITLIGSRATFSNGSSRSVFQAKKALYLTDEKTFNALLGSSNGYITYRAAD